MNRLRFFRPIVFADLPLVAVVPYRIDCNHNISSNVMTMPLWASLVRSVRGSLFEKEMTWALIEERTSGHWTAFPRVNEAFTSSSFLPSLYHLSL